MISHVPESDRTADMEASLLAVGNPVQFGNPFDVDEVRGSFVSAFEHGEEVCATCKKRAISLQLLLDGQKLPDAFGFVISKFRKSHGVHVGCSFETMSAPSRARSQSRAFFF